VQELTTVCECPSQLLGAGARLQNPRATAGQEPEPERVGPRCQSLDGSRTLTNLWMHLKIRLIRTCSSLEVGAHRPDLHTHSHHRNRKLPTLEIVDSVAFSGVPNPSLLRGRFSPGPRLEISNRTVSKSPFRSICNNSSHFVEATCRFWSLFWCFQWRLVLPVLSAP
jgi:hypothetical protein